MSEGPVRLIGSKEIQQYVPYSITHIWRLMKAGKFPPALRIGPNRVAWEEPVIRAYQRGEWKPETQNGTARDVA